MKKLKWISALQAIKNTNSIKKYNLMIYISDQNILDDKFVGIESSAVASLPIKNDLNDLNDLNYQIILKFLKPTWIQLRNKKDQIVFSKLMNENDEYSYLIADNYAR